MCVILGFKFNRVRDDLLNLAAATSNLNYCDKRSPCPAAGETGLVLVTEMGAISD